MTKKYIATKSLLACSFLFLQCIAVGQVPCFSDAFPAPAEHAGSIQPEKPAKAIEETTDTFDLVFHIMHLGEAIGQGGNISDAQIESAVLSLNRDFGSWPIHDSIAIHPNGVDTKMFFRLACRNPQGLSTGGIVRVDGRSVPGYEKDGFLFIAGNTGNNNQLVALSRWPTDRYINIWVTHLIQTPFSGLTFGGGFGPGSVIYNAGGGGLYLNHRIVGCDPDRTKGYDIINPYGKIISHEMGHYFGLLHTFQGESCTETNCNIEGDRVCDTEPHNNARSNDISCNESIECGTREPTENLMNYSGVLCGNIFTQGQKNRMKTFIQMFLPDVPNQTGCTPSGIWEANPYKPVLAAFPNPCGDEIRVETGQAGPCRLIDLQGRILGRYDLSPGVNHIDMRNLPPGMYHLAQELPGRHLTCRFVRM